MKLEFDGTTLQVPTTWREIKLGDYERWFMKEPEDRMEYVNLVADICNTTPETLLEAPSHIFDTLVKNITFITDQNFEPQNHIEIADQKYFIPLSEELTLGEWVDVEAVLESESTTKISEILSVLCRPAGEKYDTKISEQRRPIFRDLPCDAVLPLVSFFLHRKKQSEKILNHCSTVKDRTSQHLKDINHLAANGGGIKSLPIWQKVKYYFLIRYLKKQLSKYSDFYSTE